MELVWIVFGLERFAALVGKIVAQLFVNPCFSIHRFYFCDFCPVVLPNPKNGLWA